MKVYAVQQYRIDTFKENDRILALYKHENKCKEHVDKLNDLYNRDGNSMVRCQMGVMEVNEECGDNFHLSDNLAK